jgi:biotin carboxyl carrier protein
VKGVTGKVGGIYRLSWLTAPRGPSGQGRVRVESSGGGARELEVRWRRDADGLWVEFPHATLGFDFAGEAGDDGRISYRVSERQGSGEWKDLVFTRAGEESAVAGASSKKKGLRIRAQMPGRILKILAKAGQKVERGQALVVMEAMKMENEIKSPADALVSECRTTEGQAVETGADLMMLEPL